VCVTPEVASGGGGVMQRLTGSHTAHPTAGGSDRSSCSPRRALLPPPARSSLVHPANSCYGGSGDPPSVVCGGHAPRRPPTRCFTPPDPHARAGGAAARSAPSPRDPPSPPRSAEVNSASLAYPPRVRRPPPSIPRRLMTPRAPHAPAK